MRGRGREGPGGVAWRGCRVLRGGGWSRGNGRCGFQVDWSLWSWMRLVRPLLIGSGRSARSKGLQDLCYDNDFVSGYLYS